MPVRERPALQYDAVISLGANCETAYQLKRLGLRTAAGPFDWFVTYSVPRMAEQIENGFRRFMELEDLVLLRNLQTTYALKDAYNACVSYHDFPLGGGPEGWKRTYPSFRAKLDRRTARFNRLLRSGGSLLFVRTGVSQGEAERLRDAIARSAAGPFELLVVGREGTAHADAQWESDRIRRAVVRKGPDWRGDDASWDRALGNVSITRT